MRRAVPALLFGLLSAVLLGCLTLTPAEASERGILRDVVVPGGAAVEEAHAVFGDVRVEGEVAGDVKCAFGDIVIEGPVGGDVEAGFGDVYINDRVGGSVDVGYGDVELGPEARIEGHVSHRNGHLDRHAAAVVDGNVMSGMASDRSPPGDGEGLLSNFTGWLLGAVGLCAAAVLLAVLGGRPLEATARSIETAPGRSLLLGAVSLPAAVGVSVLLAVTLIGIPLLVLAVPAYLALLFFGLLVTAYTLGRRLLLATGHHRGGDVLAAVVGAAGLSAAYLVPVFGGLILLGAALLGTGAALVALISRQSWSRPRATYSSYEEYLGDRRERQGPPDG